MLDKNSFMPFVAIACIAAGGAFVALIRNWDWGVLSIPSGVTLIIAAVVTAVFIILVTFELISGLLMLIPAGLTAFALLFHAINMVLIKGSVGQRVELLILVMFVAMVLLMIGSLAGRKNLDRRKMLFIGIALTCVALFSCFIPLFFADKDLLLITFFEILESTLPLILYFAAYVFYFAGIKFDTESTGITN